MTEIEQILRQLQERHVPAAPTAGGIPPKCAECGQEYPCASAKLLNDLKDAK